ncbi:MAG: hypothetical protein V3T75_01755, partial [candidate division Zixibacteria bacterium]
MKKATLLTTSLILCLAIALFSGCSSDDASTDSLIPGDTNSVNFQLAENLVGAEALEAIANSFDLSFEIIDSIP